MLKHTHTQLMSFCSCFSYSGIVRHQDCTTETLQVNKNCYEVYYMMLYELIVLKPVKHVDKLLIM